MGREEQPVIELRIVLGPSFLKGRCPDDAQPVAVEPDRDVAAASPVAPWGLLRAFPQSPSANVPPAVAVPLPEDHLIEDRSAAAVVKVIQLDDVHPVV